jgi:hypothetical protein
VPAVQLVGPAESEQYLPTGQGGHEAVPLAAVEASVPAGQLSPPRVSSLAPVTARVPLQETRVSARLRSVVAL